MTVIVPILSVIAKAVATGFLTTLTAYSTKKFLELDMGLHVSKDVDQHPLSPVSRQYLSLSGEDTSTMTIEQVNQQMISIVSAGTYSQEDLASLFPRLLLKVNELEMCVKDQQEEIEYLKNLQDSLSIQTIVKWALLAVLIIGTVISLTILCLKYKTIKKKLSAAMKVGKKISGGMRQIRGTASSRLAQPPRETFRLVPTNHGLARTNQGSARTSQAYAGAIRDYEENDDGYIDQDN